MKFSLFAHMERSSTEQSHAQLYEDFIALCQMADDGAMHAIWSGEHHGMDFTIAPNPFITITDLARRTRRVRLGTGTVVAPFWHPIKLAGEAAMTDLITGGRLELGVARGAYSFEYERLLPGLDPMGAGLRMRELIPAVKKLWEGDYAHEGEVWQFPSTTSAPKPLQQPHPPIWVAARSPITFDYAIKNDCNIMSWPLTRPFSEAELYKSQLDEAMAAHPGAPRRRFAMMRHTALYEDASGRDAAIRAIQTVLGQFENLFRNLGDVNNGFPKQIPLAELTDREQYNADMLEQNLMFGSPDDVIGKLRQYEALGVDDFIYYASMGLGHKEQKRSLELFCKEVLPAFA